MKLLFSGATHLQAAQPDRNKSLGGYMSSTPIPNGKINALFSPISLYAQKNASVEVIGIFLLNDTNAAITGITLQQIYEEKLGIKDNQAKFEWGIVEPNSEFQIEMIGSRDAEPFYADFFEPETIRESCILKLIQAADNENVTLLGETIPMSGNTILSNIDDLVAYFSNIEEYLVEKYSDNQIYIKKQELTDTGAAVELRNSTNVLISEPVNLSGYQDGETEISATLAAGAALGIWIKRTVLKPSKKDCAYLTDLDTEELLEVLINHN